jgi:hypothetical protein
MHAATLPKLSPGHRQKIHRLSMLPEETFQEEANKRPPSPYPSPPGEGNRFGRASTKLVR